MFKPTYDKIVVKPFKADKKNANGIYLPNENQAMITKGVVIATGPGRPEKGGKFSDLSCVPGDFILYATHSGRDMIIDKKDYHIMQDTEVLIVLDPESDEVKSAKDSEEPEA